ncbi:adenylyl-sulfate kinase [Herminiimonas arsenitoxidans]|uniref:adenylyl-sulfate kinase n=1 Tax=Herminiimonas arsenitoxidans TaxID=1809410 RepID=UPI000970CF97|nr:adenylyl-sulfate kinase [Herminiimonas arsenitoxidans]
MVVWIIGLSGAGKTTLANAVVEKVRARQDNVVLIDGDAVREMFGNDLGYTIDDRLRNAERICQLCKFLESQNINVVCAILSLFPESRAWNRMHLKSYFEVFIDVPLQELETRDSKGIYRKFRAGEIRDVAGLDIPFLRPQEAHMIISNDNAKENLLSYAGEIAEKIQNGLA